MEEKLHRRWVKIGGKRVNFQREFSSSEEIQKIISETKEKDVLTKIFESFGMQMKG